MSTLAAIANVSAQLAQPLSPTLTPGTNAITVSWVYISSEDGMKIYRSTNFGQYYLVNAVTSPYTSSWVDYGVVPGNSYSYEITGYNGCGESQASMPSIALTIPALPDLVVDSLSVIARKDSLIGRFIVANRGSNTAILPFRVGVTCNSVMVADWQTTGNLLNGWYLTFNFRYKTASMKNALLVCADYTQVINETSELNNCLTDTIYALPVINGIHASSLLQRPEITYKENEKTLKIVCKGDFSADLFDSKGRAILSKPGANEQTIVLRQVSVGTYLLRVNSNLCGVSSKLLVVR
jgi:hypothetical protein